MIAKFHSAPGHSMETTLTINIPPAQSARGQRERAKEEKERAAREEKEGKEKVKSPKKPSSRGAQAQNRSSASPKAHASGSGQIQADVEPLPYPQVDSEHSMPIPLSPIESDDKADSGLGEPSETEVVSMDVESGMAQVQRDSVVEKEREEQHEREEQMKVDEAAAEIRKQAEEEVQRKRVEEEEEEMKRIEEEKSREIRERREKEVQRRQEEEEERQREQDRERERERQIEEQQEHERQLEDQRLLEVEKQREEEEQRGNEQQLSEEMEIQPLPEEQAVEDSALDVEMLDVQVPTPPPVTEHMAVDQEPEPEAEAEPEPEAQPAPPKSETRVPAQKSSRRRRPERAAVVAATPPAAETPPPQAVSSRSKGRQDHQQPSQHVQGPPADYNEPHPMSHPTKATSYKEKFQKMRDKYEKVVSSQSTYQHNLELLTEKLTKLQAENDLLLDAVLLAEPDGYQQYFPSPPGSPSHPSAASLPSGSSQQPSGPNYPYPNLPPHPPAHARGSNANANSSGFLNPGQAHPRHHANTSHPPQIQQSHSTSLGGLVSHSHTTPRSRDNRESRHSRSQSRSRANSGTVNGGYQPGPGPIPPPQAYPTPAGGVGNLVGGPPPHVVAYGGPAPPHGGGSGPYGPPPAIAPGLQSPVEVVSPRGHGRGFSGARDFRDGVRERERGGGEREREREWNGDLMVVEHDGSYPPYIGRERDRDRRAQHSPTNSHLGMYPPPPLSGGASGPGPTTGLMAPPPAPREREAHRERERDRPGMPQPLPGPGVPIGGPPNPNGNGAHSSYPPNSGTGRLGYHRNGSSTGINTPAGGSGGSSSNSGGGTPVHLGSPANGGGHVHPPAGTGSGGSSRSRRQSTGQPRGGHSLPPPIPHSVSPSPVPGHLADYGVGGGSGVGIPGSGADESLGGPSFAHLAVHVSPPGLAMPANGDVNGRRREREHPGHHRLRSLGHPDSDMLPLPGISNAAMMPTASPSEPPMEIDDEEDDRFRGSGRDVRLDSPRDYYERDSRRQASRTSSVPDAYPYRDSAPHGYSASPMHPSNSRSHYASPPGLAYDHPHSSPHAHGSRHSPDYPTHRFSPDPTHVAPVLSPAGDGYLGLQDDEALQEDRSRHSRRSSRGSRTRAA